MHDIGVVMTLIGGVITLNYLGTSTVGVSDVDSFYKEG